MNLEDRLNTNPNGIIFKQLLQTGFFRVQNYAVVVEELKRI